MEPVPETLEAIRRLTRYGDTEVATELLRIGRQVSELVPETVGVSLGLLADRLTFTLVASNEIAQQMDVVQYLDDGPCVASVHDGSTVATSFEDLLDEDRWQLFARAMSANGIQSSLSLPIIRHGRAVAGVNLYASTPDAFDGHHEGLARICGAWAPGAVANADLSFSTRAEAAATPGRMQDQNAVDQAVGMLAESQRMDLDTSAERLRQAADRAGISESQAARLIIRLLSDH
jgi:GAF domain-containing protein